MTVTLTKRYCFHCKEVTRFIYCDNCGKWYCAKHAQEEIDGDWESGFRKYSVHLIRGKSC